MTSLFGKYCCAAGIVVGVVACSFDSVGPGTLYPPNGPSCSQGTITANGPTVSGAISNTGNCKLWDAFVGDAVYTASYDLTVTGGQIYSVTGTGSADDGPLENTLVGLTAADTQAVFAASSGNAFGNNAGNNVLWFYAPASGTYSLRAMDRDTLVTDMAYTMQVVTCPVVGTVLAKDTDYVDNASSIGTTGCKHQYSYFGSGDSTFVNYYLVQFNPRQVRYFNVQSSAFTPGWEVGGPNFDSMWDLTGTGAAGSGNNVYVSLGSDSGGTYTLDVGSTTYGGAGAYTLSVVSASLAQARVPQGAVLGKTIHLKASQRVHILR
jgi:hypothetical protein